jgi:hypothetical protein
MTENQYQEVNAQEVEQANSEQQQQAAQEQLDAQNQQGAVTELEFNDRIQRVIDELASQHEQAMMGGQQSYAGGLKTAMDNLVERFRVTPGNVEGQAAEDNPDVWVVREGEDPGQPDIEYQPPAPGPDDQQS